MEDHTTPLVAVVTGASSGIGLAAAVALARLGFTLGIVGRDATRLAEAGRRVEAAGSGAVTTFQCDFENLAEVRRLAQQLRSAYPRLVVLANNAGGVVHARRTTVDGYEATIQSNHLAPFLLSVELREQLRGGRIVNTSSGAHTSGALDPDHLSETRAALARYGSAKQANILFAAEAARRWPDILSVSYHPGVVRTRFGNDNPMFILFYKVWPFLRSPEKGAQTLVWLSTVERSRLTNGAYYQDLKVRTPSARAADPALAARLWAASLAAVGATADPAAGASGEGSA